MLRLDKYPPYYKRKGFVGIKHKQSELKVLEDNPRRPVGTYNRIRLDQQLMAILHELIAGEN